MVANGKKKMKLKLAVSEAMREAKKYNENNSLEELRGMLERLEELMHLVEGKMDEAYWKFNGSYEQLAKTRECMIGTLTRLGDAEEKVKQREAEREHAAHVEEVTCMDLPLDWNNLFYSDERAQGVHTDSISDALVKSLTTLGQVDIEYISAITGADYKTVIQTLKGSIYQNPDTWEECFYKGWETSEEYLSGNLRRKWNTANEANKEYNGYFADNLKAIEKVLPPMIPAKDIYVTLGSPWVPADVIDEFIEYLFGNPIYNNHWRFYGTITPEERNKTIHDEITGTWEIPNKSRYNHNVLVRDAFGTKKMEALHILEKTLNMRNVAVWDKVSCPTNESGEKRVINEAETVAVIEKQQKMIKEFQKWIWKDKARKKRLKEIYESKYGCVKRRMFDGSFLEFPGMSLDVKLYPYQKDAVARIIFTPNTLLAHDVGAGKTYVMVAAGQEKRRMGLSKKNLYVVPNNIVGQWREIFLKMYPQANILCVEPKTFTPEKRASALRKIRKNDYDGIIMAYSCFEQIPLSRKYYIEQLKTEKKKLSEALKIKGKATAGLKAKEKTVSRKLAELSVLPSNRETTVCFDDLGVTGLYVDEAHNFKNVPIDTKITNVLGISSNGSKRCQDMMDKVHMVQKNNDGKGVVLATGTPITNSVTDVFIMQQYLQSGQLAMLDLQSFDSWIGMFAEKVTEFEIDVDTSSYRLATRFAKFHNLPELTTILSSIADFHQVDETAGIPEFEGYRDVLIKKSPDLADFLKKISARADIVRHGEISKKNDNMLKITTDGRKAALDIRLVDPMAGFTLQSKVSRCAETVADIYFRTTHKNSAQLIFCDTSTPKAGFNIYSELKQLLIVMGVPEDTIAFIHDANTEAQREKLFEKVRKGEIRVLIGSTFKLGLGVNVQDRLVALHHIDVPWRPADMTQREGRILRQGNTNDTVYIYRYITEGSFDAYSWQLLETKQRFISDLLSGSLTARSGADVENTVLDYAEVKALAIGNPLVKKRVEAANELARYRVLQKKLVENRMRLEKELLEIPGKLKRKRELIENNKSDAACFAEWEKENPTDEADETKKEITEKRKQLREEIATAVRENTFETRERTLMTYKGFDLVLPTNMRPDQPYVWLVKTGKYYVELGSDLGVLMRLDNCLTSFDKRIERLSQECKELRQKKKDIKAELAKDESYADRIEYYRKKVEYYDKELGVEK